MEELLELAQVMFGPHNHHSYFDYKYINYHLSWLMFEPLFSADSPYLELQYTVFIKWRK
jgi:hypothetical protein